MYYLLKGINSFSATLGETRAQLMKERPALDFP